MTKSDAATVDSYIANQPAAVRPVLEKLRAVIGKAIPGADETISYGMPAYKLSGRIVVYFAAWKQHTALYPASGNAFASFADDIAGYETSKGTIRFPLDKPLPVKLIERIAKFRAQEVAERKPTKAATAKTAKKSNKAPVARKKS
jgi:uncharacterized protein YdhG (YjbR/CyaY superfamily)